MGKDLMTTREFADLLGLRGVWGRCASFCLMRILGLHRLNEIHRKVDGKKGPAFSEAVLQEMDIRLDIPAEQLNLIPQTGGFFTISNHHFGAIDGLILSQVFGSRRPDYKILTTFILSLIPGLKDTFLPVNNFGGAPSARSINGLRMTLEHIGQGRPLGLFPAGEVATWQKRSRRTSMSGHFVTEDIPWADNIIRLIRDAKLPVIPVYFEGTNSLLFHLMGKIHPKLRTVRLLHELVNKRGRVVSVRIGRPISPEEMAAFPQTDLLGRYLRNRCYALESQCGTAANIPSLEIHEDIAPAGNPALVAAELESQREGMLFESGDWRGYLLRAEQIPYTLQELARLREETFRLVGEGTGNASDSDAYDQWYRHLILWNIPDGRIGGAYRIGLGSEIVPERGIEGLYTTSLLRFGKDCAPLLARCIELGRSFIVSDYQRDVLALKSLFTGLALTVTAHPECDYFLGPVSISNAYPTFYKSLMVYFLQNHYPFTEEAGVAVPTHPFQPDWLKVNPADLLAGCRDVEDLDRLMVRLSDGRYRIPVLVRQYFKMGARLVCFNIDKLFNDSLDGLILLKFADYPENTLRSVVRCLPAGDYERVMKRFGLWP